MRALPMLPTRALRWLRPVLGGLLVVSTIVLVGASRHWPLVGDASLIHYICFLMDHGFAPYRDLGDMNMPGSFLIEWAVMHTPGGGEVAWSVFDFGLLGTAAWAMVSITDGRGAERLRQRWFPGVFAGCLLALVHGRDGMGQLGQRDLTMAIALLTATAFLFRAERRGSWVAAVMFGVFAGVASAIKPTALPFGVVLLGLATMAMRRRGVSPVRVVWAAGAGYVVAPAVAMVFLLRERAVNAFVRNLRTLIPFYASLGHKPMGFLLLHSISPLLPVVLVWLAMLVAMEFAGGWRMAGSSGFWFWSWERLALGCGVGFGLLSYVVQARGFPYYRYPLLVFLLPLMAMDFEAALERVPELGSGWREDWRGAVTWMAVAGVMVGGSVIAPTSAYLISRYDPTNIDFITSLERELDGLGGADLSGHVQCIDSIAGCGTTLYRMRLVQSTGVLSDFLLFGPTRMPPGGSVEAIPIVRETRAELMLEFGTKLPRVLVVSSYLHIDGPDGYAKLGRWPAFEELLASRYSLRTEWKPMRPMHWWSRQQMAEWIPGVCVEGSGSVGS
jgi:hypothetical protein